MHCKLVLSAPGFGVLLDAAAFNEVLPVLAVEVPLGAGRQRGGRDAVGCDCHTVRVTAGNVDCTRGSNARR